MKLFIHQLGDIYYVEKQLLKTLPKMAHAAHNDELSAALEDHLNETEGHVDRLEQVFETIDRTARAKKCDAMDGILEEAKELMDDFKNDEALDAAIIAAGQKVEHYEITTYGTLCAWAEELGLDEAASLLSETLDEEKAADDKLSELAEGGVNAEADEEGDEEERTNGRGRAAREDRMATVH